MPLERRKDTDLDMQNATIDARIEQACAALIRGEEANWELARLTHESTRDGRIAAQDGDYRISLTEWSERIRERSGRNFARQTAGYYRMVWERFGRDRHHDVNRPSWVDAWTAVFGDTDTAERFVASGARKMLSHMDRVPPEVRQELATRLLAEPEIAERIENDFVQRAGQDTKLAARIDRVYQEFHPTPVPRPEPTSDFATATLYDFGGLIYAAIQRQQDALSRLLGHLESHDLTASERVHLDHLIQTLEKCRTMITDIENRVSRAAGVDYDEVFRRLVNG